VTTNGTLLGSIIATIISVQPTVNAVAPMAREVPASPTPGAPAAVTPPPTPS
jgi:hypothetical protein